MTVENSFRLLMFSSMLQDPSCAELARHIRYLNIDLPLFCLGDSWLASLIRISVRLCSHLTDLRLSNILLSPDVLSALSQARSLRSLSVYIAEDKIAPLLKADDAIYFPVAGLRIPPLESLRLEPPVKSSGLLIESLRDSLKELSLICELLIPDVSFEDDLRVPYLHFPKLERLAVQKIGFKPGSLSYFLDRHRQTIMELNIVCPYSFNLSWAVRVMRNLAGEDVEPYGNPKTDWSYDDGREENESNGVWGRYFVNKIGFVLRKQHNVGEGSLDGGLVARKDVVELGLSFPIYANNEDHPLDGILPLSGLFDIDCLKSIEKLSLSKDIYFDGIFSEFVEGLSAICVEKLPKLRHVSVGWNTLGHSWCPHHLDFYYQNDQDEGEDSELEEGQISEYPGVVGHAAGVYHLDAQYIDRNIDISALISLPAGEDVFGAADPGEPGRALRRAPSREACTHGMADWVAAHRVCAERLMGAFMGACAALETVDFYFGRLRRREERCWAWRKTRGGGGRVVGALRALAAGESIARGSFVDVGRLAEGGGG